MTENDVSMEVAYAVALFDAATPSLELVLLPFQPTGEEIAELQADESFWLLEKESPDAEKWPTWSPHGTFTLSWGFEPQSLGDPKMAWVHVYSYGIGSQGSNLNISRMAGDFVASLDGAVKEGETVTLTSAGSEADMGFTWDLKVQAKVLKKSQE